VLVLIERFRVTGEEIEMQPVPPRLPRLAALMHTIPSSTSADFDPAAWCVNRDEAAASAGDGAQAHAGSAGQASVHESSAERELQSDERKTSGASGGDAEPGGEDAYAWFNSSDGRRTQDVGVGTSRDQSTIGELTVRNVVL
jgi:hypothetical protein